MSMAPATTSSSDASPASWPLVRGRPRALAHRPLPSMTIATCLGSSSAGTAGAVAPDGCGKGLAYMGLRSVVIGFAAGSGSLGSRSGPLDEAQRPQPSLDVPLEEGGDEAVALPAAPLVARVGDAPVTGQQGREQLEGLGGGRARAGRTAYGADGSAGLHVERPVRPRRAALGAVDEARRPAGDGERAEQVGVEDETGVVGALGERAQRAGEQEVLLGLRLVLLGQLERRLEHRRGAGVGDVVPGDRVAVGSERLDLGDGVEVAALIALDVDDHAGLEARAETGLRASHPLGDRADAAPGAGQHRDDAVGLAQLVGAQDDRLVTVEGHGSILPRAGAWVAPHAPVGLRPTRNTRTVR